MMRLAADASNALPKPIVDRLGELIRRARAVIVVRGTLAVAATVVLSLLVVMAIDASVTIFATWPRWLLTLSALSVSLLSAWWFLVRPLARTFSMAGIARAIEQRHPELHERISSAVELLDSRDAPELRGSEALIHALAQEAANDVTSVLPKREISLRPLRAYLLSAVGSVVVLLGLMLLWPDKTSQLLARAIAPYANIAHIGAADLTITPGDATITADDRLRVEVTVRNSAVTSAQLRLDTGDGSDTVLPMSSVREGDDEWPRFALTCPPASESFRYRVFAGDGPSRYYDVTVVRRPAIENLQIRYEYPSYTRRATRTEQNAPGTIRALARTVVTIRATLSSVPTSARFIVAGKTRTAAPEPIDDGRSVVETAVTLVDGMKSTWRLEVVDEHGFENRPTDYRIEALTDTPPSVQVVRPEQETLTLPKDDRLAIRYAVGDDVGLKTVELVAETGGRETIFDLSPRKRPDGTLLRAGVRETILDLSKLDLRGGKVTWHIRAADSLPADLDGPQVGESRTFTIRFSDKAETYLQQVLKHEEATLRDMLKEALEDLREARERSRPLAKTLARLKDPSAKVLGRVGEVKTRLTDADGTVGKVVAEVTGGVYSGLGPALQGLSDRHIRVAISHADRIRLVSSAKGRASHAEKVDFHVDRSIQIVEDLLLRLGDLTKMAINVRELTDLARDEQTLADALEQLQEDPNTAVPPGDREQASLAKPSMSEQEWADAQKKLVENVGEMIAGRDIPGAMEATLTKQAEAQKTLSQLAKSLAKQQEEVAGDTEAVAKLRDIEKELADFADQQQGLQDETLRKAAQRVEQAREERLKALQDAAERMEKASRDLDRGKMDQARKHQAAAEKTLGDEGLPDLAEKQKALREEARSLAKQDKSDTKEQREALKKKQDVLREETLKRAVEPIREELAKARALRHAAEKVGQALEETEKKHFNRAERQQRDAEKQLAKADQPELMDELKQLQDKTRELDKRKQDPTKKELAELAGEHEQLREELLRKAAESLPRTPAERARALREAARKTIEAAEKAETGELAEAGSEQGEARDKLKKAHAAEELDEKLKKLQEKTAQRARAEKKPAGQELAQLGREHRKLAEQMDKEADQAEAAAGKEPRKGEQSRKGEQGRKTPSQTARATTDAAREMGQATGEMTKGQLQQARKHQAAAEKKLSEDGEKGLARKQKDLREKTEKLARQRGELVRAAQQEEMKRLREEQEKVAREAARLADDAKADAPTKDDTATEAAITARKAERSLDEGQLAKASADSKQAAETMRKLADQM
ncbi:MAG: DUF4175 family protein, partial [Phycisphaerae bacterium]